MKTYEKVYVRLCELEHDAVMGDILCKELNCRYCPFFSNHKICLSGKLDDPLIRILENYEENYPKEDVEEFIKLEKN